MIRRPPRSTPLYSSAASDVYKRQVPVRACPMRSVPSTEIGIDMAWIGKGETIPTPSNAWQISSRTPRSAKEVGTETVVSVSVLAFSCVGPSRPGVVHVASFKCHVWCGPASIRVRHTSDHATSHAIDPLTCWSERRGHEPQPYRRCAGFLVRYSILCLAWVLGDRCRHAASSRACRTVPDRRSQCRDTARSGGG